MFYHHFFKTKKMKKLNIYLMSTFIVAAFTIMFTPQVTQATEPDYFTFSAGIYDINDDKTAADFRAEYRSDMRIWKLVPFVGLMGTCDSAFYAYAGLGLDLFFGSSIFLTPNAAFGAYEDGDGKELGGTIEFRTGAELAWRRSDYSRLGVAFHHISNASIYDSNPGTELLVISYSVPFTREKK